MNAPLKWWLTRDYMVRVTKDRYAEKGWAARLMRIVRKLDAEKWRPASVRKLAKRLRRRRKERRPAAVLYGAESTFLSWCNED